MSRRRGSILTNWLALYPSLDNRQSVVNLVSMKQHRFLIEGVGPDGVRYGLDIAESGAACRAWIVWFGRSLRPEGWTDFNYYPVPVEELDEMLAEATAAKENNA